MVTVRLYIETHGDSERIFGLFHFMDIYGKIKECHKVPVSNCLLYVTCLFLVCLYLCNCMGL